LSNKHPQGKNLNGNLLSLKGSSHPLPARVCDGMFYATIYDQVFKKSQHHVGIHFGLGYVF